jgi:hypothetical protein
MVAVDTQSVKVYTVNGAAIGSASSLPDWLVRKRAAKAKGKRAIRERVEGSIELIQHFEFPEASNRIKTTRDGHHVIATGTYKPQMRVWDLDQLALKFERHADIENIDFIVSFSRTLLSPTSEAVTMAFFLLLLVSHTKPANVHTPLHRSSLTTGQRHCISKRTARSNCTHKAVSITAHGYRALAVRLPTTSPAAMRSLVPREMRCTD